MIVTATTHLFPTMEIFSIVITGATLRARGLYTLGVQSLCLYYHVTLALLNHHIRRLLAVLVSFKPTTVYFLTRLTRMTRGAVAAHKMEYTIFFLNVSAFWNKVTTDFTSVNLGSEIRTAVFSLHIRIKDRAHPVF
jgi:hypothetical protein